ncbi:membrane protein [Herbaspirillum hiltneri N3]|uniref:Membrane protein n=1 Tax=Herbaspirillum hiltneri N3 TaxID=1262470 RepID=A0ABM5V5K9_9BURK|nr:hypothetical protein [Herbaspirillum hiltneri]AKZ64705.1 membrane protein [Herbaspirillum hiltneri N3]
MINSNLHAHAVNGDDSAASGVSWGAILAGAFAAAALSFILVILGFGLGFSSVSPWSGSGLSAQTIGWTTIAWITFTQIAASAIGGYMAGRLRVKWASVHTDEVYFRDTAHGFLAWAVASLATAALLSTAIGSVISSGAKVAGSAGAAVVATGATAAAGGAAAAPDGNAVAGADNVSGYFIDSLFRAPATGTQTGAPASADAAPAPAPAAPLAVAADSPPLAPAQRNEVMRIFANALRTGALPAGDKTYVAQVIAKRSGISQAEAEKRVDDSYAAYKKAVDDAATKAKEAADTARKAAAYGSLWMFVALLCGAFIASLAATFGGRLRDRKDRVVYTAVEPTVDGNRDIARTTHESVTLS